MEYNGNVPDVGKFNVLCARADTAIKWKMHECQLSEKYYLDTDAAATPADAVATAADAVAAAASSTAAAAPAENSTVATDHVADDTTAANDTADAAAVAAAVVAAEECSKLNEELKQQNVELMTSMQSF